MQFRDGTGVFTADDQHVGNIDRVVIDPETKEVVSVVVRKGFLLPEDKVVPISLIAAATGNRVTLREDAGDLEDLPTFDETHYLPLTGDEPTNPPGYARPVYWYPPAGVGWWGYPTFMGYPNPPYAVETERNIPEGTVPLKEGARVVSSDGDHVGNVKEIMTDPQADRATHILVSQGILFKEQKLIPFSWVRRITEEQVDLRVRSEFLNELREYPAMP
jgi:uncharacterized protein YrrD